MNKNKFNDNASLNLSDEQIRKGNERLLIALDLDITDPSLSSGQRIIQMPGDAEIEKHMNFGKLLSDFNKRKKAGGATHWMRVVFKNPALKFLFILILVLALIIPFVSLFLVSKISSTPPKAETNISSVGEIESSPAEQKPAEENKKENNPGVITAQNQKPAETQVEGSEESSRQEIIPAQIKPLEPAESPEPEMAPVPLVTERTYFPGPEPKEKPVRKPRTITFRIPAPWFFTIKDSVTGERKLKTKSSLK